MDTYHSQPHDPPSLPSTVDVDTATVENAYTEQAVREDALKFGDWVVDGAWFYSSPNNSFYRLTTQTAPFTFTLTEGTELHPETTDEPVDTYPVESIVELGAEILKGTLRGILPGSTIETEDAVITNTGEYLIVTATTSTASSVDELTIESPGYNPRFTDGSAASLFTPVEEQSLTRTRNEANRFIYTVNGSKAGIAHLLPDTVHASDGDRPSNQFHTRSTAVSDGGSVPGRDTQGVHPDITEIPHFPAENPDMVSRFIPTSRHLAETFQEPNLRKYALAYMEDRVLNACAGPTDMSEWYSDGEIIRNDLHPDVESDISVDIAELACHFPPNSFDTILFDPPWSAYQSRMRYDGYVVHKESGDELPMNQINLDIRELPFKVPGEDAISNNVNGAQLTLGDDYDTEGIDGSENRTQAGTAMSNRYEDYIEPEKQKQQIGHARLAKLGFDYLLKPGGRIIQYAYTGSVMPAALDYTRLDRTAFDPTGTYRTLIGGVDRKNIE